MGVYKVVFQDVAISVAEDLFAFLAPADSSAEVIALFLGQRTELADAAEEQLRIHIQQGATTVGSGGAAATFVPQILGQQAFGGSGRINDTTEASAGTIVTHEEHILNIRVPFQRIWLPEERPVVAPSTRWVSGLVAAPADEITASGTLVLRTIS